MELKFQRLGYEEVPAVRLLMKDVTSRLPTQDLFSMDDSFYLNKNVEDCGEIYGAFRNGDLVAYSVLTFPGVSPSNLGREFGVPENELLRVAVLDSTVVHESVRGNGLQRYFHSLRENRAYQFGCLHIYSTVHPDNYFSQRNLELSGFTIQFTRPMYGGLMRHCLAKRLNPC